jgi:hypothetical protein
MFSLNFAGLSHSRKQEGSGRFQATGTPMVKILRLHLSAQCALREITILHNFAIEKVEKNISLQRFRDLKTLFQNCFKRTVNYISNFKVLGKQSFSICFPPASCFMQILFHLFCKVCMININIFFA